MHSHQSYPNITTVIHSYEYSTTVDNSTIETYRNRGLGNDSQQCLGRNAKCDGRADVGTWAPKADRLFELYIQVSTKSNSNSSTR